MSDQFRFSFSFVSVSFACKVYCQCQNLSWTCDVTDVNIYLFICPFLSSSHIVGMEDYTTGSYDYGDPTTTNIFLGSINPKVIWTHCKCLMFSEEIYSSDSSSLKIHCAMSYRGNCDNN